MYITEKIDNYLYPANVQSDVLELMEVAMFMEDMNPEMMNEGVGDIVAGVGKKLNTMASKLGIHGHKTGAPGIVQVALASGKIMASFIWYGFKAAQGDAAAKEKVKELANTEITKEQVVDFLLKLDMLTLHAVSGPLHIIDALTGWHIWANIKKKTQPMLDRVNKALDSMKELVKQAEGKVKTQITNWMHGLARLFGMEDAHHVIKTL